MATPLPIPAWSGALLGCALAAPLTWALWGFTVDDAFIPARVATHLLDGLGPRFNRGGPITDAVTPLGFAHWLALLTWLADGEPSSLGVLQVARVSGLLGYLAAAALLGQDLVRVPGASWKELFLGGWAFALCVPLAAWAGSGLETPWVVLLATWATRPRRGADLAAGAAAAWRPELLPWSLVLVLVRWRAGKRPWPSVVRPLGACLGPALGVLLIRALAFDRALPLSLLAKEPEWGHGLRYASGALLLTGPWWLLLSRELPAAARARPGTLGALVAAGLAHVGALSIAGGDWMPFFRLMVPVLPSIAVAGVELAVFRRQRRAALAPESRTKAERALARGGALLRLGLPALVAALLLHAMGADARRVFERRTALIEAARPLLAEKERLAAVDVGWLGAATSADLVDLAGVTDPRIAALPGGHTTKRVAPALLGERNVDGLVFLAERGQPGEFWAWGAFRYGVEARLAPGAFYMGFRLQGRIPLAGTNLEYLVCGLDPR